MSEIRGKSIERATSLFDNLRVTAPVEAHEQYDPAELWKALEEERLTLVSVPEESGGAGGSLAEAAAILRLAGRYAAPIPLAETGLLAGWALSASGFSVPEGPLTIAPVHLDERVEFRQESSGWSIYGRVRRIPAARMAGRLVVFGRSDGDEQIMVASVEPAACDISPGENLAGEPRDEVAFDGVRVSDDEVMPAGPGVDEEALWLRGALARSILMTGALERILELSVRHANERHQFGRPIGRFQAIQHQLAVLAGEVAAASAAVESAVAALDLAETTADSAFEIASAKVRVGEAAGTAAAIAHQVHGAIGFTERHPLRHSTLRLWAWRDEFGTESEWASRLGSIVAKRGPDGLWPSLTSSLFAAGQGDAVSTEITKHVPNGNKNRGK